jgi:uncharacterized protein (DUF2267 family)
LLFAVSCALSVFGYVAKLDYRRVAEREGADSDTARKDASAVMQVLGMAVTHGELDKVMAQLPAEFNILFRVAES